MWESFVFLLSFSPSFYPFFRPFTLHFPLSLMAYCFSFSTFFRSSLPSCPFPSFFSRILIFSVFLTHTHTHTLLRADIVYFILPHTFHTWCLNELQFWTEHQFCLKLLTGLSFNFFQIFKVSGKRLGAMNPFFLQASCCIYLLSSAYPGSGHGGSTLSTLSTARVLLLRDP